MSPELLPRAAAIAVAVAAATRAPRPGALALLGAAGAIAALGVFPGPVPDAVAAGAILALAALAFALVAASVWPPLAGAALAATLPLAAGAAACTAFALRGQPWPVALGASLSVAAALALLGAEGARASAEAGWRRAAGWGAAALLSGGLLGGLLLLPRALPRGRGLAAVQPAAALAAGLLAWLPFLLCERRRILVELREEIALGILPEEDLLVLSSPWRRSREARFGRPDERREYVRSALLLAVARHQQRQRHGEAVRLRQLEILSFRTRLRRLVELRAGQALAADLDALG